MQGTDYQNARPLKRALAANANSSAFTAKAAMSTGARPTGNLLYPLCDSAGELIPARLRLYAIGLGSDNDAFSFRVYGWSRIGAGPDLAVGWLPALLGEYGCVVSTFVGVAASPVLDTERFADTFTIVSEPTITADVTRAGTTELYSPANNTPGWIEIRTHGVEMLEFDFDQTTGTPTMNLLLQQLTGPM